MTPPAPRPEPLDASHFDDVLALNAASVAVLSPLSPGRLACLHGRSAYHRGLLDDGRVVAFLLGFAPGADYDSANYRWFDARYDDYLYVDRIVVADTHRGRGLAALLYSDLFAEARRRGAARVVCEFDVDPPNTASAAFHRRFGFVELGTQRIAGNGKRVSLQSAPVGAAEPMRAA